MSSPEVITIGYEGRTVDDVIAALVVADVKVVVDVRLTPRSRKAGLSKHCLVAQLDDVIIDYLHLPQLGNPRDNRAGFRRGDTDAIVRYRAVLATTEGRVAIDELLRLTRQLRVALMCFEREATECHRSAVAEAVVKGREALLKLSICKTTQRPAARSTQDSGASPERTRFTAAAVSSPRSPVQPIVPGREGSSTCRFRSAGDILAVRDAMGAQGSSSSPVTTRATKSSKTQASA